MTIADINAETRSLCDADTNSYTAADLLRRVNASYERRVGQIIGADGLWQFDDSNYTDFPIATTTLVAGQQDYTFDSTMLEVEGVSIKDANGNYQKLTPIDDKQLGVDPTEFLKTDGMPTHYDKQGRSILLYPAPAAGQVTLTAGMKVFFKRTADVFTSAQVTTGTKQPGFAAPYHVILAYDAAIPYCMTFKPEKVNGLRFEADRIEKEMLQHYGRREQDRRKRMTMQGINSR